jgi:glutathione S-transferase
VLTVLGRRNSNNVIPVMWAIGELGLEHKRESVGGSFGGNTESAYRDLNPNGYIPTLLDDDFVIYESNAIVRYISDKYGSGHLAPTDIQTRAIADQWMEWYKNTLYPNFGAWFMSLVRTPKAEQDTTKTAAAKQALDNKLAILDDRLKQHDYIAGADFSMADIPLGTALNRYFRLHSDESDFTGLHAWIMRLRQRPAFQEHVDFPFGSCLEEFIALEKQG